MSTAYRSLTPASHVNRQTRPRELGVYELPDGREYVVSALYGGACCLYPVRAWGKYGGAEFLVDGGGLLLRRGTPSQWTVWDLKDTGRTASYPRPIIL